MADLKREDPAYMEDKRASPRPYRRMDTVPWARRVECRHLLMEVKSYADVLRDGMLGDSLNADGAVEDCDAIAEKIAAVRRLLLPPKPAEPDTLSKETLDLHLRRRVAHHLVNRHGQVLDAIRPPGDGLLASLMTAEGCSVTCVMTGGLRK